MHPHKLSLLSLVVVSASGCLVPNEAHEALVPPVEPTPAPAIRDDAVAQARSTPPAKDAPARSAIRAKEKPAWMKTADLFASAELVPVEANLPVRGMAHFYGGANDATMHLRISGLAPGEYGAYLGKDCKSAAAMRDSNPFDQQGAGSVTVRPNEMKIGVVSVDRAGAGELDAAILSTLHARADLPPLTERAIILMPASAERVDQPQTKVACGMIESVRGS